MRLAGAALVWMGLALPAGAFEPASLPDTARVTVDETESPASLAIPVSVYDGTLPREYLEGRLRRRAWQIWGQSPSTLRLIRGLRGDLERGGFQVLLDCESEACGGFDFRYALPVLPAPEMNVDLYDFRVVTAVRPDAGREEYVYILVSKGRADRFVQIYEVVTDGGPAAEPGPQAGVDAGPAPVAAGEPELVAQLRGAGHAVLRDLDFASGAEALADRKYPSLAALAGFLNGNPARVVALVGHTDAVGSLAGNTALSQRRAEAVRTRLISAHGVPGAQVSAHGVGYLAPVASNLEEAGREANRRVEVVLLAAE